MDTKPVFGRRADCERLSSLHPRFAKAFTFLKRPDLARLPPGRYAIDGDDVWANVADAELVPHGTRKVEWHRRFIDIQAPLSGPETLGVRDLSADELERPFDDERDIGFIEAASEPVTLSPGEFAIFPPACGHAPACVPPDGATVVRKLVIKIRAD